MEEDKGVSFNFHSNTLEESFIAILKDSDNSSGDSLGEQVMANREDHSYNSYGGCTRVAFQIWGVFIKNVYFHKSIFLQSFIIYNINILIVLIATLFNQFVTKYLTENMNLPEANGGHGPEQPPVQNNMTIQLLNGYFIMASAYIHSPVYEKEKKIRALLNTRGLSWPVYWLGNFLFDFTIYNLNLLVMMHLVAV